MPTIELSTLINAPIERCFNMARSIDLHIESTKHTGERAIAGRTSGLIEQGETVTWRARHFGVWQNLTSKIIELNYPNSFTDELVEGAFKSIHHQHQFRQINGATEMKDIFRFESPFGILGKLANILFLRRYMTKLLENRNKVIKEAAESMDRQF